MKTIFDHRSIRRYTDSPVSDDTMERILTAATRASTVGNMQLYSLVVTTDRDILDKLSPLHFGQIASMGAPVAVTVCCDVHRFSRWCSVSQTEPSYDNMLWFVNGAIDALLASQNMILEAEANGLGACVLGTTLYNAAEICDLLRLPCGVAPVTTVVMGHPAETPSLTERLPLEAVVHRDTYRDYDDQEIKRLWAEKEALDYVKELVRENGTRNLAEIFTTKRYPASDSIFFTEKYMETLKKQGFLK
ncbi:MAG: nitroreductase family protein [Rikenellaceae bacterium]|nr:nitroreductase family protein [Rikenellaceae bacterium]